MAKRERSEDLHFGLPEKREKTALQYSDEPALVVVKREDEDKPKFVTHQHQFGAAGGDSKAESQEFGAACGDSEAESQEFGASSGDEEESQEYYSTYDVCDCTYSHIPFSLFGFATQYTAPPKVVSIAALYPGYHGNWAIRGRVVYKRDVRSYDNANGTGTYFWFEMKDDAGGEIRVVCFTYEIAMFFDNVIEGNEYVLSRGRLQRPNDRYNQEGRRCEIVLQYNSTIKAVEEKAKSPPASQGHAIVEEADRKHPEDNFVQAETLAEKFQHNATNQASQASQDVKAIQGMENPDTVALEAQNEALRERVAILEKDFHLVSSQALESSTQLQDCKARLEELEAIVKEGKMKAQTS